MQNALLPAPAALPRHRDWSLDLIFAVSFALLLVVAVGGATLGMKWRDWLPGAEGGGSLVGSVRSAVCTFMSYLP